MNAMLKKYISLPITLLLMVLAITACNNELEQAGGSKDKVDVILNVNTRAVTAADPVSGEGIHTLRVIVAKGNNIETNKMLSFDGQDPITSETITLHGLETGKYRFYIIANEASLSEDAMKVLEGNNLRDILAATTDDTIFPCFGTPSTGLPMVGQLGGEEGVEINENNTKIGPIELRYIVSKIVLNIKNETGVDVNLKEVKYKNLASSTSLFGRKLSSIIKDAEKVFSADVPLTEELDEPVSLTYYFYPTSLELEESIKKALQIALTTNSKSYDFAEVKGVDGSDMKSIEPHQQVNINGKITSSGSLLLTCEVADWKTGNDMHLDYSNLVSYSSFGWEDNLPVSADGVVSIKQGQNNILKFKIQSPKGAKWSADLIYKQGNDKEENRFTIIKPEDTTVDGSEQSITVTCSDDNTETIEAELVIQVSNVMNNRWPVYLFPSSDDEVVNKPDGRKHYTLKLEH